LIVTGATASVKGSANFAVFAAGKWAKRALSQPIAREYYPKGVHIAHAVIDGVIDIPRTAGYNVNGGVEDGKIAPESVSSLMAFLKEQSGNTDKFEDRGDILESAHTAQVWVYLGGRH
jgi:NADP-dependent 3-hydroxy acid dehydrogenase YdfG